MNSANGILVTGSHRSGTTWVGRTINFHPSIRYVSEPFNIAHRNIIFEYRGCTWFPNIDDMSDEKRFRAAYRRVLFEDSVPSYVHIMRATANGAQNAWRLRAERQGRVMPFLSGFADEMLRLVEQSAHGYRTLIKDPLAVFSAEWLAREYDLQVLCVVRNPVAFAGSIKKWNWQFDFHNLLRQPRLMDALPTALAREVELLSTKKHDVVDGAALLWNVIHHVLAMCQQRNKEWLFIRYEDVAREPSISFRNIFRYLDLEFSSSIEKKILQFTTVQERKDTRDYNFKPRNSLQSLTTWETRLTRAEVSRVVERTRLYASAFYQIQDEEYS